MRSLWSPVLVRTPILLGSGLLWPEPWAGLQHSLYTHTQTYAQHSWGHSLSTSGARLLPPQPDKSPRDTNTHKKKHRGPNMRGGTSPISALLQAMSESCYCFTPTGFGQKGGKKKRCGKNGPKWRDAKRERDGRKKGTFRSFHTGDYDKWPGL